LTDAIAADLLSPDASDDSPGVHRCLAKRAETLNLNGSPRGSDNTSTHFTLLIPVPEVMVPEINRSRAVRKGGRNETEFWLANDPDSLPFGWGGPGVGKRRRLGAGEQSE
jgi:hypothetical protein